MVYELLLNEAQFVNSEVTHDLDRFKARSDIIVANRMVEELDDVSEKVLTRDCSGMTKIILLFSPVALSALVAISRRLYPKPFLEVAGNLFGACTGARSVYW